MSDGFHMPNAATAATDPSVIERALATLFHVCNTMDAERDGDAPSEAEYQVAMYRAAHALGVPRDLRIGDYEYKLDEVGDVRRRLCTSANGPWPFRWRVASLSDPDVLFARTILDAP